MNFIETDLPGVIRVVPTVYDDERGCFMETRQARKFGENGIDADFVQDNFSQSSGGALRGIHYQIQQAQGKLIRVVRGQIFDIAVDLRRTSPLFSRWTGVVLSDENRYQLWVPPGFGHGFLALSEVAEVDYKCTDYYAPEFERTIRWDDPDIGVEWPIEDLAPVLSKKDRTAPYLKDAETYL